METPSISIIIPTKDRTQLLNATLDKLFEAIEKFNIEILVINDSKDSRPDLVRFKNKLECLDNPGNGVASARNHGAKNAKGEWLIFLDDDMIVSKENIKSYIKHTINSQKVTINIEWEYPVQVIDKIKENSFGRFLIEHGFTSLRGWCNNPEWMVNTMNVVSGITSQNLLINKRSFLDTGGYNEDFPLAGFEDYALSRELQKHGFTMYVDTTSLMYHNEIDRLSPNEWFKRKERGGITRKVAVELGYTEITIQYSFAKKIFYFLTPFIEPAIKFILAFSSKFKLIDALSFACYKMLLGISIYKGYTKK